MRKESRELLLSALFGLGLMLIGVVVGVIVWRVVVFFTVDCVEIATGTQVECGDLRRSTVFIPAMFAVPLVPIAVLLMAPWAIHRGRA